MQLKPILGPIQLIFYCVGVIIGAGVYSVTYTGTNSANDVIIRLTNGQVIYVLNAASDFQAGERNLATGVFEPFNPGDGKSNLDDFQWVSSDDPLCNIDCESPTAEDAPERFDFCDDLAT